MKKTLFSLFIATSLLAAPQAVVFDWGDVLAKNNRSIVVDFMCQSLHLSPAEFEAVNLEKRKAVKEGQSEVDFWLTFAHQKKVSLPSDWPKTYAATLKASIGADPHMFALIDELKGQNIRIALLSNIDSPYVKLIRECGFYASFDPCLLSCEIGIRKPDPKAYEALLQTMQVPAKDIVFIDDKSENIEAAKALGIDGIVFESAEQIREELSKRNLLK